MSQLIRSLLGFKALAAFLLLTAGCAALFGWDIHAPGLMSQNYFMNVREHPARIALYLQPSAKNFISKERGGRFADPQTFHVGEAFAPMALEAFQHGFGEFIYLEAEPSAAILKQYGIPYLAVVSVEDLNNKVTMKGQAVEIVSKMEIYNQDLELIEIFEASGVSDAQKVFAKKGGPEVNLNAAVERNITALVQHIHDALETGSWQNASI